MPLPRQVRLLEFEYHDAWPPDRTLRDTLAFLGRRGYRCWWQGGAQGGAHGGRDMGLALASPGDGAESWCAGFGVKAWSNLVCAHEAPVVTILEALVSHR